MKILIIRLSSIGDVILTTPVLRALKEKYPDIQIDFVVLSNFAEAIAGSQYIDNIITFDKQKHDGLRNILAFGKALRANNYDYVFDLHCKTRSKLIAYTIGAKTYSYKKRKLWKSILVKLRLIKYHVDDTIIKNYFGAFKDFGITYSGEKLEFAYAHEDGDRMSEYGGHPAFALGASKNTKKWPVEYFGELGKLIYDNMHTQVVLVGGGKADEGDCATLVEQYPDVFINLAGKCTLKETGALLARSQFLICNDSAPFHISRAVGTPAFVMFCPTDPGMFDIGERDTLLYAGVACAPCSLHGGSKCPKGHFACMREITPQQVFDKINSKQGSP